MAAILARLKMTFSGQTFATKERATEIDIGGADNEPIVDASGNTHSVEKLNPGKFKCSLLAIEGFKLRPIQEMRNGTIIAEGNNGLSYMMRNAVCEQARVISAGGEISATFIGDVEEM